MKMKKIVVTFCVIMLLSLGLLVKIGIVGAYQEGYEINDWVAITEPTMDGEWTPDEEWEDTEVTQMDGDLDVEIRMKYVSAYPDYVNQYYLVEFFDDTSLDENDYLSICYAAPLDVGGSIIGGTTPQTDCIRLDVEGHDESGAKYYNGDGSAWVENTSFTWPDDIELVSSVSASPSDSTPHLIIELKIEHLYFGIGTPQWIRLAVYDENNDASGEQAWPESSVEAPDEWGNNNIMQESIPEGLTFAVMVFLSSISLVVGSRYLRKRSKEKEK